MKKSYRFWSSFAIRNFFLLLLLSTSFRSIGWTGASGPVIVANPYDRSICEGANTFFTIQASGVEKYVWQVSQNGGITWITASGGIYSNETSDTLLLTGATQPAQYRCIVEGGGEKDTSAAASLHFFIVEQSISTKATQVCENDSTQIVLGSSQIGLNYYLRRGNVVVGGPYAGTGSSLSMNTGPVPSTSNFSVLAQKSAVGSALSFDGTDDYVIVNNGYTPLKTFTFSLFIYPNDINGGKIFSSDVFELLLNAGGIEFKASGIGSISYNSIAKNAWSHLAVTYDGTALNLYINGTKVNTVASTGSLEASTSMAIGRDNQSACCYFNGKLDEFRVRSKYLSQAEVQESMTDCITGMEADVVAYYRFDDGAGSPVLTDLSGHGHTGSLKNMNPSNDWVIGTSACGDNQACSRIMIQTPRITVSNLIPVITSTSPASRCEQGSVVLKANASAGKISWFAFSTGGVELATGPTFTTPALASTTAYYVSSTDQGCTSKRTEIIATINPLPDVTVTVKDPTITAIQTGASYQWLDCKKELQSISGAIANSYTPAVNGTYAVAITLNGCTDTSKCMPVTVTGIEELTASSGHFVVFPNPSNGEITIQAVNEGAYTIVNELGQAVRMFQLTASNNYTMVIDNLTSGMYVLVDMSGQQMKKKIVITR
jgi:hypothetical protein